MATTAELWQLTKHVPESWWFLWEKQSSAPCASPVPLKCPLHELQTAFILNNCFKCTNLVIVWLPLFFFFGLVGKIKYLRLVFFFLDHAFAQLLNSYEIKLLLMKHLKTWRNSEQAEFSRIMMLLLADWILGRLISWCTGMLRNSSHNFTVKPT